MTKLEFFDDNKTRFSYCPNTDHPFRIFLTEEELRFVRIGLYYVLKNLCFDRKNPTMMDIKLFKHQFDLLSKLHFDINTILEDVLNCPRHENK